MRASKCVGKEDGTVSVLKDVRGRGVPSEEDMTWTGLTGGSPVVVKDL